MKKDKRCSFCGEKVENIPFIESNVSPDSDDSSCIICLKCAARSQTILSEEHEDRKHDTDHKNTGIWLPDNFRVLSPREVASDLARKIIGQPEWVKTLSLIANSHLRRLDLVSKGHSIDELPPNNALFISETGSSKTYSIQVLAKILKKIGILVSRTAMVSFSAAGYWGRDTSEILKDVVMTAGGGKDVESLNKAMCSIIHVDEIDKISHQNHKGQVNSDQVQGELLNILEPSSVKVLLNNKSKSSSKVDEVIFKTDLCSFICTGAFSWVDWYDKHVEQWIGFRKGENAIYPPNELTDDQLVELLENEGGMLPELIGRLPIRLLGKNLTADDLATIMMKADNNVLTQEIKMFSAEHIDLIIDRTLIDLIAEKAFLTGTNGRSLYSSIHPILKELKFEYFGSKQKPSEIIVSERCGKIHIQANNSSQTVIDGFKDNAHD